jgi:hypothetical protein
LPRAVEDHLDAVALSPPLPEVGVSDPLPSTITPVQHSPAKGLRQKVFPSEVLLAAML